MKKLLLIAALAVAAVSSAKAEFVWSWWVDGDTASKDVKGCVLGLGSTVKTMTGAQLDLCISKADQVKSGCQGAIGYSRVKTLRNGCQFAFWNDADNAALQFGLICRNKGGFLPWFVFFNFDKTMFGSAR